MNTRAQHTHYGIIDFLSQIQHHNNDRQWIVRRNSQEERTIRDELYHSPEAQMCYADKEIAIEMSFLEMSGCFAIHFRRSSCACSSNLSGLTGAKN
jgi:hypothetical protein